MSDLKRTQETWRGCDPKAMSVMSPAAIFYALTDAKHDIVKLHCDLAALREELATVALNLKFAEEGSLSFAEEANLLQQRLADAEQRNAELISAVRSINRGKHHEVLVPGDDEPQYRQRKEWVDWVLGLCDEASGNKPTESGASE